jgi:hypothetical protein
MTKEKSYSKPLPVKDFAKKSVCDGHLFLQSGERKFYLMKPGILIDPDFVKKHASHQTIFQFEQVVNEEVKFTFQKLLRELRYLQFERDVKFKCIEILTAFERAYSNGEHILSFALACHEELCAISFDEQMRMHETDMHLFRKSLYAAALSVIVGISNDYYHFLMLKDFYNLTFSLDIGLCDSSYSYYVAEACNAESREPGAGKRYLEEQKATDLEVKVYLKHPELRYEFLKMRSILIHPELAEVARYQHELADGRGFPRGIPKGQISTWEAVVIFSSSLVEITSEYQFEKDVLSFLLNADDRKLSELPVNKVYKKLTAALKHLQLKETGT